MNKINKYFYLMVLVLIIALAFPLTVSAASISQGKTVVGETYTLESGEILNGDLNVIGGVVDIEAGAAVNGDMFVLGGLVTIDGTIEGSLTVIGGTVTLEGNAVIEGDLISPASFITQETGSIVQGDQTQGRFIPWKNYNFPMLYQPRVITRPEIRFIPLLNRIGRETAFLLMVVGLGALMLLVMPKSAEIMSKALTSEPWHVLGYGALTALAMLVGGVFLTITICFIPVVIIVGLAFGLAVLVGWLVLGYELGKRIAASLFKSSWHPVLAAAVGNLVLYLTAKGLELIPCLGGFLIFVTLLFGLGTVITTLFGTKVYPRGAHQMDDAMVVLNEGDQIEKG